ncbi:MAG: PHP domain-containing protein, partial [Chloroflexi bacterium]|nr:PHP domain-containing protein [Chloroflexota bacterium]
MRNQEVAELLSRIADLLEMKNESPFRIRAYREAARQIGASPEDVADLHREGRLRAIPGVGESIAGKVAEYLDTGRIQYYDDLRREIAAEAAELLQVPWIGPVRARTIYEQLGVQSLHELERAAEEHMLSTLPGIGERIEEHVRRELGRLRQRLHRLPLGVALPAAEQVMQLLRSQRTVRRVEAAGSLRRMCETVGDVDILVGSEQPDQVIEAVADLPVVKQVLARGPARMSVLTEGNVQVSIRVFPPDHYGSALQHFTGSRAHNLTLRDLALNRGYRLSEYGLFDGRTHRRIAGETEEGVYAALGLPWIPPELREHRGEIEAALEGRLPRLVTLEDIRSDLHLHTNWSDGRDSAEAMIEEAIARGHEYVAITDHSASLGVAHGLSVDRIREQRRFVDALNAKYAPFRVLHGAEVEILPDGALDYPDEVLATLDLVTVSVHSALRQP